MSIALRLALLLAMTAASWLGVLALFNVRGAGAYPLAQGAMLSVLVLAAVALLLRYDRLPGRLAGHAGIRANAGAFLCGVLLWLGPAMLGFVLCTALGWSSVSLRVSPATLLATLPLIALGVFLVEAFPEELAFRGYVQGLLGTRWAPWSALLGQAVLFVCFAWAVGALGSLQQWMFLPGFALILGYTRALGSSVWMSMGVHTAWMTTTQLLSPGHGLVSVTGMQALHFVAFALLPSATLGVVLAHRAPRFRWRDTPLREA